MSLSRYVIAGMFAAMAVFSIGSAEAASALGAMGAPKADTLIEKVWGSHSSCEHGRRLGWHRHVGYYARVVRCDPYPDRYVPAPSTYDPPPEPSYTYPSNGGYGSGYGSGYGTSYYTRPEPSRTRCHKDWHCRDNGNPFDGKRECYWRNICN